MHRDRCGENIEIIRQRWVRMPLVHRGDTEKEPTNAWLGQMLSSRFHVESGGYDKNACCAISLESFAVNGFPRCDQSRMWPIKRPASTASTLALTQRLDSCCPRSRMAR